MTGPQRLKARWVFPVDRPPIENGIVEVTGAQITAVRSATEFEPAIDLGDVALLPGLVNAHTHLEFSLVERPFEPALPFTDWIRSLLAYRRATFPAEGAAKSAALQTGREEAARSGTTLLADIATDGWTDSPFDSIGPRVIPFRELIGLRPESVAAALAAGELSLATFGGGISPHAPYSVSSELLNDAVTLASQNEAPVAMHLAETRSELEFLAHGTGEFAEFLQTLGVWPAADFSFGRRPLDVLMVLTKAPCSLIVHGNYLSDEEVSFLAKQPQMSVVYCPRTHAFFQHEPHPWRTMQAAGVNVAVGTDGRGSNPDLSLWNELLFLRQRHPDFAPQSLLEMGTIAGSRALGQEAHCGTLTPGKRADVAVVALRDATSAHDPFETLFLHEDQIKRTMCGGRWCFDQSMPEPNRSSTSSSPA